MPILRTYAVKKRMQIDLSLSGNPFGPSPNAVEAIKEHSHLSHFYPMEEELLIRLIAKHHHLPEDSILLGGGANELLEDYLKVLALRKHLVVSTATFPESVSCMKILEGEVDEISLNDDLSLNLEKMLKAVQPHTAFIHLCNPNNPTGIWTDSACLMELADHSPVPLLISEAGADFVGKTLLNHPLHPNMIVVRSFSKAYGLAGLRIGYSVAHPEIIAVMQSRLRSYRISSIAMIAAIAAIQDQNHLQKSIDSIMNEKRWLIDEIEALNFKVVPSQGQNFIARVPNKYGDAKRFCKIAKHYGVSLVDCSLYRGLEHYVRITPQRRDINNKFINILHIMEKNNEYQSI